MPPRYAYWTILVDGQPTAFRAALQDDLMPTFKRLKDKHPSAEMKWFQNGRLWTSRLEAQEAMRERGERGRQGDARQGGGFRDRKRERPEWKPRTTAPPAKLEWTPKGEAPARPRGGAKPEWKPKGSGSARGKLEFKPKGTAAKRDRSWRPGGEHKDPRQKYKDAKKAKWQRFKQAIRTRWDSKHGPRAPKKRRDDES